MYQTTSPFLYVQNTWSLLSFCEFHNISYSLLPMLSVFHIQTPSYSSSLRPMAKLASDPAASAQRIYFVLVLLERCFPGLGSILDTVSKDTEDTAYLYL